MGKGWQCWQEVKFERRKKMPYITVESGALSDEQKELLIKRLTEEIGRAHV